MNDKAIVITQLILLVILVYTLFKVSVKGVTNIDKVILTVTSLGILAFDKIKFIAWVVVVALIWLIRYSKKDKQHGREST